MVCAAALNLCLGKLHKNQLLLDHIEACLQDNPIRTLRSWCGQARAA